MGTTRFSYTNRIESATPKNGTGGGAPALDQVAGFPMTNAQTSDRRTVWQQASGLGTVDVDFDLGANRTLTLAGLLGHRPTTTAGLGVLSAVVLVSTAANGYPPTAASSWTLITGTIDMSGPRRDAGLVFGSVSVRYVRFELTVIDAFTLGRFYVGTVEADMAKVYSPGAKRTNVVPRSVNATVMGAPVYNWLGDSYYLFSMKFGKVNQSDRDKLDALANKKQTVLYVDHNDVFREVAVQQYSDDHVWNNSALYDCQLDLAQLG